MQRLDPMQCSAAVRVRALPSAQPAAQAGAAGPQGWRASLQEHVHPGVCSSHTHALHGNASCHQTGTLDIQLDGVMHTLAPGGYVRKVTHVTRTQCLLAQRVAFS